MESEVDLKHSIAGTAQSNQNSQNTDSQDLGLPRVEIYSL